MTARKGGWHPAHDAYLRTNFGELKTAELFAGVQLVEPATPRTDNAVRQRLLVLKLRTRKNESRTENAPPAPKARITYPRPGVMEHRMQG